MSTKPDPTDVTLLDPAGPLSAAGSGTGGVAALRDGDSPAGWRSEASGDLVGNFHLLEKIGEGGFGTVWKASQEVPLRRMVAVKIIKPGMDSREIVARFALERQALAMMSHPGIAAVFDAGTTEAGRPYFAMEFVDGLPVSEFCDEQRLDAAARLRLMLDVCAAVQHAHQKGIIHRDLKPSNILVCGGGFPSSSGSPEAVNLRRSPLVKVIDFGVARAIEPRLLESGIRTADHQFIGTPAYMSPEQASMGATDIDTRTDIYSLGVLLYQLLTGTTPFAVKTAGAAMEEVRRIVRDEPPPAPSTAISRLKGEAMTAVAAARNTALKDLSRLLRRDLDWIVIKALEKDRDRRYPTASALAMDIRRYLAGEPVLARPPGLTYRAGKFIRRYKRQAAAAAAILVSLTGGLAASTTMLIREKAAVDREAEGRASLDRETAREQTQASLNEQTAEFLGDLLASLNPDVARGANTALMRKILTTSEARIGTEFKDQPRVEAFLRNTIGSTWISMGFAADAKAQYEQGLKVARASLGDESRLTLRFRNNLANMLHDPGEAEKENRGILEIRRRTFGDNDRETLATIANLAEALGDQGKLADAEKEYADLARLSAEALGSNDPDTLKSRIDLANTRGKLGQNVVEEYRSVVDLMESNPEIGASAPDTLAARFGLADALFAAGELREALQLHTEVFHLREKVLSPTHRKTLQSRYMIGASLLKLRDRAEAAKTFVAVLELQEQNVKAGQISNDHRDLRNSRSAVATTAHALADPAEAERQLRKIITATGGVAAEAQTFEIASKNLARLLAGKGKAPDSPP